MSPSLHQIQSTDILTLHQALEVSFSEDTRLFLSNPVTPSAGHCAVVSILLHQLFGAQMMSTYIGTQSHWFNRFLIDEKWLDVDLTGDQFGFPTIQIAISGTLYKQSRQRFMREVNTETRARLKLFRQKPAIQVLIASFNT